MSMLRKIILLASFLLVVNTHGDHDHSQIPIPADADWATRHMIEEHHIQNFDPDTFFTLHDFDSTGAWSPEDVRRLYGFYDPSTSSISDDDKSSAVNKVIALYDMDRSNAISYAEFTIGTAKGLKLPDFGYGPGHHGDDEYEYEIHHWENYHGGDDVKEEDLIHPEDVEHFRKHDEEDRLEEEWEKISKSGNIVEKNIPKKFLRVDL